MNRRSLAVFLALGWTHPLQAKPITPEFLATLTLLHGAQAGSRLALTGEHGLILLSDDVSTWRSSPTPTQTTLTRLFFLDDKNGWACGHDQTVLHTTNGGESWTLQHADSSPNTRPFFDILFLDTQKGFVIGAYGDLWETLDGGAHWVKRPLPAARDLHLYAIRRLSTGALVLAGESGLLLLSENEGKTWTLQRGTPDATFFDVIEWRKGELLLSGLSGKRWTFSLSSQKWSVYTEGTTDSLYALSRNKEGAIFLGGGRHVAVSTDGGKSVARLLDVPFDVADVLVAKGSRLVVVGTGGVKVLDPSGTK